MIIDSCNYLATFRLCSMRGGLEDKKDKKDKISILLNTDCADFQGFKNKNLRVNNYFFT